MILLKNKIRDKMFLTRYLIQRDLSIKQVILNKNYTEYISLYNYLRPDSPEVKKYLDVFKSPKYNGMENSPALEKAQGLFYIYNQAINRSKNNPQINALLEAKLMNVFETYQDHESVFVRLGSDKAEDTLLISTANKGTELRVELGRKTIFSSTEKDGLSDEQLLTKISDNIKEFYYSKVVEALEAYQV